ncbi:hypothetical protein [Niabella hirudinis]|uniref:hypothetical protein n=1 Tax=Niabella hirudinis TaxID=1285929 RepID=UPI003EBD2E42
MHYGEPDVQVAFKQRLIKKGFLDVLIPKRHFEIGRDKSLAHISLIINYNYVLVYF